MSETEQGSPRSSRRRVNKIYRTPPTPPPGVLRSKEKTFILDCNATSSISCDYSKANPKLGPVIPPYNSQRDNHVNHYFTFHGVDRTLSKTGQVHFTLTMTGQVNFTFTETGQVDFSLIKTAQVDFILMNRGQVHLSLTETGPVGFTLTRTGQMNSSPSKTE